MCALKNGFDSAQGFPYEYSFHMVRKDLYVNRFYSFSLSIECPAVDPISPRKSKSRLNTILAILKVRLSKSHQKKIVLFASVKAF